MKLNNLSRLTALLLAIIMCMSTLASAEGVDVANLTINKLNEWDMYAEGIENITINPSPAYYGASFVHEAFASMTDDSQLNECTFQWWDALNGSRLEGETSRYLTITQTYEEQVFHCIATDAAGNEYKRSTLTISPADKDNVLPHYLGLTTYYDNISDKAEYRRVAYKAMTQDWNVTMTNGKILADGIWGYWAKNSYPDLLCTCCIDDPNQIMLAPDAAHKTECPWYEEKPIRDVVDEVTGITVTGDIPEGVELTVNQVSATLDDVLSMINLDDYAEAPTVLRYDITLTLNDEVWQPTTPVTVKVPDVYETVPTDPLAEVIHMTSAVAAGYEKLANVTVNTDGSLTFDATGFSNYYIVAGQHSNGNNTVDDYYILPGVTIELTNVTTYQITYPEGKTDPTDCGIILTHTNGTLTFYATKSATLGDYIIQINNSNRTERIHVQTLQDFLAVAGESQLFLTCLQNSTSIPNEPMAGSGFTWRYFYFNSRGNLSVGGYNEYTGTASDVLKIDELAASPKLEQNLKGQNVIGVIDDNMGADTLPLIKLDDDEWHELLVLLVKNYTVTISDGTELTSEMVNATLPDDPNTYRYKMYPYVIKYIPYTNNTWSDRGWHVDCAVVDTLTYSITYEFNIPDTLNIEETSNLVKPTTAFYSPNTLNIPLGDMKLGNTSLSSTDTTVSIYNTLTQSSYEYEFKGWSTSPTGEAMYQPGYEWPKLEGNLILYAIWDYKITTGMVQLTKNVVFEDPNDERKDDSISYEFTISFTNSPDDETYPYSITADGSTVTTGVLTNANNKVSLRHGDTLTIHNVPDCTVNIEEVAGEEYSTTWSTSGTGSATTAEVKAGIQTTITCTNTYAPLTGNLTITKIVEGPVALKNDQFTFTVILRDTAINGTYGDATFTDGVATVTLKGNESKTITGLPANVEYTVTEAPAAGYTATSTNATGMIVAGDTVTATFTNTYSVADLTITKTVVTAAGVTAPANDEFEITVMLTAADGAVLADNYTVTGATTHTYSPAADKKSATLTLTMTGGQIAKIFGIQTGTKYTVIEADKDYYKGTIDPDGQQTLNANAEVTVTNKYQTGNLTVTKQVAGTFAPKDDTFTFTLTLKDGNTMVTPSITVNNNVITWQDSKYSFTLKNGENITIYGIPVGVTYTVTETENPDYTTTVNNATGNFASAEMTDAGATADFVNTYKYSQLTITKTVSENTPAGFAGQVFDITVSLPAKQEAYTYTSSTREGGTIQSDGKLTIKAGETITIDRVPINTTTSSATYTVTEEEPLYFDVAGEVVTATAVLDSENKVELTNTYKPGSLTITKAVQAADGVTVPTDDEFAFTVTLKDVKGNPISGTFSYYKNDTRDTLSTLALPNESNSLKLKAGESVTFTNLPAGATYTVVEDKHPNYELTAKTGDTGTITETVTTAAFTNTYQYSDLKISKTTVNNSTLYKDDVVTDDVFTFMVNLSSEGNYTYVVTDTATGEAIKDESGNAITGSVASNGTLTLASGQTVTIKNIPVGTTYTVEETAVPEFVTTVAGSNTGTIEAMVVPVVAFTNTYSVGQLTIRKTVVDNSGMGYDLSRDSFTFDVVLMDADDNVTSKFSYYVIDTETGATVPESTGSVANGITLKANQTAVIDRIPAGVTYTVTETNLPTGYTQTTPANNADVSGRIDANVTSTAAFTNTYNTGSLTIHKTGMTGNEAAVFTVTGFVRGEEIRIKVVVPNGESTTINGLDIGGRYDVSEVESWTWRYTSSGPAAVTIPTDGKYNASVTFENTEKHDYWLDGSDYEDNRFGNTGN